MKRNVLPILFFASALLLAGIAAQWLAGERSWQPPEARRPEPSSLAAVKIELSRAEVATLTQTLERPLFAKDRRPNAGTEAVATEEPEVDPFKDVVLLGTFGTGGAGQGVILRAEGKVQRVHLGESMGPWNLRAVDDRVVTFERGAEQKQLVMKHLPQQAAPSMPVAGVPPTPPGASAPPGTPAAPAVQQAAPATQSATSSNGARSSGGSSLAKRIAERRARLGLNKK